MGTERRRGKVADLICGSQNYSELKDEYISVVAGHELFTGIRQASETLDLAVFWPRYTALLDFLASEIPYVLPTVLEAVDFWEEECGPLYSKFKTSLQESMRGFAPAQLKVAHSLITSLSWFFGDNEAELQERAEAHLWRVQGVELLELTDALRQAVLKPFTTLSHSYYVQRLSKAERLELQASMVERLDYLELQALLGSKQEVAA